MTMMIKFYNFIMSSKIFFIINRFANHIHRSNNLNLFLKRIIAPSIVGRNIRGLSCDIGWIFLTSNQLKKSYQNWLLFLHGFQQENNKQEKHLPYRNFFSLFSCLFVVFLFHFLINRLCLHRDYAFNTVSGLQNWRIDQGKWQYYNFGLSIQSNEFIQ